MILALTINIFITASLILLVKNFIGRNGTICIILFYNIIYIILIIIQGFIQTNVFSDIHFGYSNKLIHFEWSFFFDVISLFFIFTILFITTAVLFFACSYMYTEKRYSIFLSFLQFFMFFMMILVSSKNIIQIFIGWEGVGIVSFPLINFWYLRLNANKSALKALLFNRIGDFGYIGFLVFCITTLQTTSITLLPISIITLKETTIVVFFLVLAFFGKSAQLFLYAWLPDAMEGPTPVSALLHSATMVTAGVYLFVRVITIVYYSSYIGLYFILIAGGITSIFCGIYASVKYDIKKIIAFSTCSQLGLMFCTIAAGFVSIGFYHLFIHAFFKALLFVSSGIIIHALADEQDIRKYGLNSTFLPYYHLALLIGSLNITGVFFYSGFYSKETLLTTSIFSFSFLLKHFILISSLFTIIYSIRLFVFSNLVSKNLRTVLVNNFDLDGYFLYSVISLSFMSIIIGYFFTDIFIGNGNTSLTNSIFYNIINFELVPNSILFVLPLFLLNFYIFYFTKQKLLMSGFFFNSLINSSIKEFNIQSLFFLLNSVFNYTVYKYIIQVSEKGILDNFSLLGLIKTAIKSIKNFNYVFNKNIILFLLNILVSVLFVYSILLLNNISSTLVFFYILLFLLVIFF